MSLGKNGVSKLKKRGMAKLQLEAIKLWVCYIDLIEYPQPRKWALPIRPRDIWSDDVKDPNYNLMGTSQVHLVTSVFSGLTTSMT